MEILRRETDYALRALVILGQTGDLVSTRALADECDISLDHIRKIMPRLAKADIVEAVRGAKGGFRLSRDPENIYLNEVIQAMQGPLIVNRCIRGRVRCGRFDTCVIAGWVEQLQEGIDRITHRVSLHDIIEKNTKQPQEGMAQHGRTESRSPVAP
jgi:Rrf2 family protein